MNIHDIKLPPLPYPYNTPAYRTAGAVIQNYVIKAIKADRKRSHSEAQEVFAEAYQVIGSLLFDLGIFETDGAEKILDSLSQARMVHKDVLPWHLYDRKQRGEPDEWKLAVDHELTKIHYTADSFPSAKDAIKALVDWHVAVATDPVFQQPADPKQETGNRLFAVACILGGTNQTGFVTSGTLSIREAESEQEAKGLAVEYALEQKPHLSVQDILCREIHTPQPTEKRGEPVAWPTHEFAIVVDRKYEGEGPSLAMWNGENYNFTDGDCFDRDPDGSLDGYTAEWLTHHQLEQRLFAPQPAQPADEWILVRNKDLVELSDSIQGNYVRGQDWERETIKRMMTASQPADHSGASALHNEDSGAQNGIQATQTAAPKFGEEE